MLEIGGTIAFISRLDVAKGASDGKVELCATAGSPELDNTLLGTEFPNVSDASAAEGTRGRVEDRVEGIEGRVDGRVDGITDGTMELLIKFRELELTGGKGAGTSGRFEAPVGKEALKLGNCIGCCIEEGIDNPGGGRSKDC